MGIISVTTITSENEKITKTTLNGLAANLLTEFNGNIDNNNIKATAAIAATKLDLSTTAQDIDFTGTLDFSGATMTAAATFANLTATTADINAGTVDAITSLTVANSVDIGNYTLTANGLTIDGTLTDGTLSIVGGEILDATTLEATTTLGIEIGDVQQLVLTDGKLNPTTNNDITLGDATHGYSNLFLGDGAVINFNAGNATLTHSAGILTFNVFPVTPSAAPDANYEVANKKYVDDQITSEDFWDRASTTLSPNTANDNLDMGSGNILTTGDVGATGSKITKGWFTDLAVTNAIAGSVTGASTSCSGQAATVATIAGLAPNTATTQATQASITTCSNLTTVGALNAGSITSGFTSIDVGAGTIDGGIITADTNFAGALTGNVTGDASGSSGSCTGNSATVTNATLTTALTVNTGTLTLTADAGNDSVLTIGGGAVSVSGSNTGDNTVCTSGDATTAETLKTARAINGVDFNGSAAITVTAAAGTLSGDTIKSTVTASSLISLGTITSLVATTADINAGTVDATIGGTTPAAITGTVVEAGTSLAITGTGDDGVVATGIKDEDDMTSNSATHLSTQQSIKKYVDDQVQSKSFILTNPTAASDGPIWRVPSAITITAIHVLCTDGTNIVGQLWEYDANGANGSTVDADITGTAGTNVNDDGSISNPSIDANDYLGWVTTSVSGDPTKVIVTFEYTKA